MKRRYYSCWVKNTEKERKKARIIRLMIKNCASGSLEALWKWRKYCAIQKKK